MKSTSRIIPVSVIPATLGAIACAAFLVGCTPENKSKPVAPGSTPLSNNNTTATRDPVIATVGPVSITANELQEPLMRAYGFTIFKYVVQRDMAKLEARNAGILVTPEEIATERKNTLEQMFPDIRGTNEEQLSVERERALDQFLAQPRQGEVLRNRTEFDMVLETNAYLRRIVQKSLAGSITDEQVREEFDVQYGTSVRVRHMMFLNPQEAGVAQGRLAAGEPFDKVAREMSRNKETGPLGGLLPPFTANSKFVPEIFRQIAFHMKPGDVSDLVSAEGAYHLIKLEETVRAKAIKYEDVKDAVRSGLEGKLVTEGIKVARAQLAERAVALMKIDDPILRAEFEKGLRARENLIQDKGKIRTEMEKARTTPTTAPATAPAIAPTRPAATGPAATGAPAKAAPAVPAVPTGSTTIKPSTQPTKK